MVGFLHDGCDMGEHFFGTHLAVPSRLVNNLCEPVIVYGIVKGLANSGGKHAPSVADVDPPSIV